MSILGISEKELIATEAPSQARARSGMLARVPAPNSKGFVEVFVNQRTGALTPTGTFTTPTLSELRAKLALQTTRSKPALHAAPAAGQVDASRLIKITLRQADIGELQATLTTSQQAMVQVASNFNCIEVPSAQTKPNRGNLVDMASLDHTQGPAAVFCTLSAYLLRVHFCFNCPKNTSAKIIDLQDPARQDSVGFETLRYAQQGGNDPATNINLLRNVSEYCGEVVTGKLIKVTGSEVNNMPSDDTLLQAVVDRMCVGLHSDCPVLFGRRVHKGRLQVFAIPPITPPDNDTQAWPQWNEVDHVLSASVNLRTALGTMIDSPSELDAVTTATSDDSPIETSSQTNTSKAAQCLHMCRALLRAACEGAYLAALTRQRKALCVQVRTCMQISRAWFLLHYY